MRNHVGVMLSIVHILLVHYVDLLGLLLLSKCGLVHLNSHISLDRIDPKHLLLLRVLRLNSLAGDRWLCEWLSENLLRGL